MKLLLTNDDGIFAPGIHALARALAPHHEVIVVAPAEEQSGKSRAITLYRTLAVRQVEIPVPDVRAYSVSGTPADCVRVGLTYLLDGQVDLIVSGINFGLNLANDVPYSGTVSAAMEALHLGKSAIAVSAIIKNGQTRYDVAARAARRLIDDLPPGFLHAQMVLNMNTPCCDDDEIRGRHILKSTMDVRDRYEWLGRAGDTDYIRIGNRYPGDVPETSDLYYVRENYITLSPLADQCGSEDYLNLIREWLQ